ncbi:MAG: hypothetical protein IJB68_10565 [Ruminococcus sp.]|nr:hypothetical protein [Ruminococcus sp.]
MIESMNDEIFEKLEISKAEVATMTKRDMLCPNCNFRISTVFADARGHMQVKCKKCKNEYILNFAYFRTFGHSRDQDFTVYLTKI